MEVEIKCPFCESSFVEEVDSTSDHDSDADPGFDRALSLWVPILLGMMGGGAGRRRFRREEDDDDNQQGESEQENIIESILGRRRRRSSAAILQLVQGFHGGIASKWDSLKSDRKRERECVILINPFNQAVIMRASFDLNQSDNLSQNALGSLLGDYFIGPVLDLLLQHLAENDTNRYGTPPTQKEAIETLPIVKIAASMQCSICLEDFVIGSQNGVNVSSQSSSSSSRGSPSASQTDNN
ncbi:hypothetical protein NE237_009192 [Protea cynaroides]|uniref:Uncharacterized protein n=1 Tax=Protea cynaroides TaxID=273540 RepID=A0A9Q0KX15_9MAGN|nr:hypothetical protein NE237_009192 [Protea cynaroides]